MLATYRGDEKITSRRPLARCPKLNSSVYNCPTDKHWTPLRRPHRACSRRCGGGQSGLEDHLTEPWPSRLGGSLLPGHIQHLK